MVAGGRTFLKRKGGLFKKAHELSVLCSVDVAVIIFGHNKKLYEFSSGDINDIIGRYQYVCRGLLIGRLSTASHLKEDWLTDPPSNSMAIRTNIKVLPTSLAEKTATMTTTKKRHHLRRAHTPPKTHP